MFDIQAIEKETDIKVDVKSFHLGKMIFSEMETELFLFDRSPRKVRSDMLDHFMLRFDLPTALQPKTRMLAIDLGQPLERASISPKNLSVILPRAVFGALVERPERLHDCYLEGGSLQLLADYLTALVNSMSGLEAEDLDGISDATERLIAACVKPSRARVENARPQIESTLLMRARRIIENHLADGQLSPSRVATLCGMSRARLYRLFEPLGGVAAYLQERRLVRTFNRLSDPRDERSIATIAHETGFSSEAHFSRLFKKRFGCTARDLRTAIRPASYARQSTAVRHTLTDQVFKTWVSGLC